MGESSILSSAEWYVRLIEIEIDVPARSRGIDVCPDYFSGVGWSPARPR